MELLETGIRDADLAITSFVASRHPTESCGTNGLPLTPNSIAILGQSQRLKGLSHPNLCTFLDCRRGKHERIILVTEYYKDSLKSLLPLDDDALEERLFAISGQILDALIYLDQHTIVHGALDPSNILFNKSGTVKLFNYGLNLMTNYGLYVAFPVGNPRFVAPEIFYMGPHVATPPSIDDEDSPRSEIDFNLLTHIPDAPGPRFSSKVDVWSLGMILAGAALNVPTFWPNLKLPQIVRKLMSMVHFQGNVLERLAKEHNALDKLEKMPEKLKKLIVKCLNPNESERPTPQELLNQEFFCYQVHIPPLKYSFPTLRLRCQDLESWHINDSEEETAIDVLTIEEVYYLWKLAGGDIEGELRKHGLMVTKPPILSLPKLVLGEGHFAGEPKERCSLFDPTIIVLSLEQLRSCLSDLTTMDFYPLTRPQDNGVILRSDNSSMIQDLEQTANLPLVIKESDLRYQFSRIILYRRLLQGYPFQRPSIWNEARIDSLPLYRNFIWASLLGIEHDVKAVYEKIDKESWTPTDRQIEVDIPRCHQYNNLLASPEGHRKFKRILKAWVVTNPQYVYWQGLDSLCAPFLYLNFNDEALAFASLSAFIPKYLYGMFRKDNAAVIQEYLAKFSHLQAFHDPVLFNHLDGIGFIPDLYAIPWVLTMFAHVFPLSNIFHLWDKLLLGNSSFPLCIGLAILSQLREMLLAAEFNDCILIFSDLPAIDIEKCVKDSIHIFCTTPKSLTYRKFDGPKKSEDESDPKKVDMTLDSVTLQDLKTEKVPRMSGEELLALLPDEKESKAVKAKVLVIDVRPPEEFKLGALPDSVNMPLATSFNPETGQLIPSKEVERLEQKRGKVVCIVGSRDNKEAIDFAQRLLVLNYSRLSVLHVGVEIFRNKNILCVPNS